MTEHQRRRLKYETSERGGRQVGIRTHANVNQETLAQTCSARAARGIGDDGSKHMQRSTTTLERMLQPVAIGSARWDMLGFCTSGVILTKRESNGPHKCHDGGILARQFVKAFVNQTMQRVRRRHSMFVHAQHHVLQKGSIALRVERGGRHFGVPVWYEVVLRV